MQYFQFYGYLSQQQNMMQDYVRTSTYQKAILSNLADFRDKVVLDVGAGSGILSFFAQQAGAKRVYAVEGSRYALQESQGCGAVLGQLGGKYCGGKQYLRNSFVLGMSLRTGLTFSAFHELLFVLSWFSKAQEK